MEQFLKRLALGGLLAISTAAAVSRPRPEVVAGALKAVARAHSEAQVLAGLDRRGQPHLIAHWSGQSAEFQLLDRPRGLLLQSPEGADWVSLDLAAVTTPRRISDHPWQFRGAAGGHLLFETDVTPVGGAIVYKTYQLAAIPVAGPNAFQPRLLRVDPYNRFVIPLGSRDAIVAKDADSMIVVSLSTGETRPIVPRKECTAETGLYDEPSRVLVLNCASGTTLVFRVTDEGTERIASLDRPGVPNAAVTWQLVGDWLLRNALHDEHGPAEVLSLRDGTATPVKLEWSPLPVGLQTAQSGATRFVLANHGVCVLTEKRAPVCDGGKLSPDAKSWVVHGRSSLLSHWSKNALVSVTLAPSLQVHTLTEGNRFATFPESWLDSNRLLLMRFEYWDHPERHEYCVVTPREPSAPTCVMGPEVRRIQRWVDATSALVDANGGLSWVQFAPPTGAAGITTLALPRLEGVESTLGFLSSEELSRLERLPLIETPTADL